MKAIDTVFFNIEISTKYKKTAYSLHVGRSITLCKHGRRHGGEQGGQAPTLEKIRVGMAHPGNVSRGLKTTCQSRLNHEHHSCGTFCKTS